MIKDQTDFLLDPSIPTKKENLKIADIACGTGYVVQTEPSSCLMIPSTEASSIWLVDLAKSLPLTTQLEGFDISSAHFPPKHELPANVTLGTLDSFAPVPDHLVGGYDILHCRGFMLYVANGDPSFLVENIRTMLSNSAGNTALSMPHV